MCMLCQVVRVDLALAAERAERPIAPLVGHEMLVSAWLNMGKLAHVHAHVHSYIVCGVATCKGSCLPACG